MRARAQSGANPPFREHRAVDRHRCAGGRREALAHERFERVAGHVPVVGRDAPDDLGDERVVRPAARVDRCGHTPTIPHAVGSGNLHRARDPYAVRGSGPCASRRRRRVQNGGDGPRRTGAAAAGRGGRRLNRDPAPAVDPRPAGGPTTPTPEGPRLGLRANLGQFSVLVGVNALVGGMLGQERTVLPLLADEVFGLGAFTAALTFIVAFGVTKAVTNLFAGELADRLGRKPVLVAGWVVGFPVPLILMVAPSWAWIVFANVLLGVNQGLTWSTTVVMKIDLVGPRRRGVAMGWNEAAGYGAVALTALVTGYVAQRYGLRPAPFAIGIAYAGLGLACSTLFVRETHHHVHLEAAGHVSRDGRLHDQLTTPEVFVLTTVRERALSSCSQAGLVNNLNDALAWGLFPLHFAAAGLSVGRIGVLAALYPAVWGAGQILTGGLSDRFGRKPFVAGGMLVQAGAIAWIAATRGFAPWALGVTLLGAGTAMVYPTLLAAIGDVAHPRWRARAVGVYRFWRDAGFAVGAVVAGVLADVWTVEASIWTVAALTGASGAVVMVRMYETAGAMIEP